MAFRPGARNLITDVAGLRVGNVDDQRLKSGVTAVICDRPAVASYFILGGAPGTRETDLLEPHNLVQNVEALVLSGGSAFGLDAASGVQARLREQGVGFVVGDKVVPIVPAAILMDLLNGGDKEWGRYPPYREMGYAAAEIAATEFAIGSSGAGLGALTAGLKGGLGSASVVLDNGLTVGALVAVNAVGSVNIGETGHFWAAPFEIGAEFGGLGFPHPFPLEASAPRWKHQLSGPKAERGNTTIGIVATDAVLDKAAARRLAIAAHDGYSKAIWPVHTPIDGDIVFGLATGNAEHKPKLEDMLALHAAATSAMARAIARAIHAARPAPLDRFPTWADRYGSNRGESL